ncbi:MAG TPA: hypothetical protein VI542_07355 [Candidatus Tectomicrobia bacterium]
MYANLNEQCAVQCEGYVRAGIAPNGTVWLHPPGERNRSVPVPAYMDDWQACMRLVQRYRLVVQAGQDAHGSYWDIGTADETMGYSVRTDDDAREAVVTLALQIEEKQAQDARVQALSRP